MHVKADGRVTLATFETLLVFLVEGLGRFFIHCCFPTRWLQFWTITGVYPHSKRNKEKETENRDWTPTQLRVLTRHPGLLFLDPILERKVGFLVLFPGDARSLTPSLKVIRKRKERTGTGFRSRSTPRRGDTTTRTTTFGTLKLLSGLRGWSPWPLPHPT